MSQGVGRVLATRSFATATLLLSVPLMFSFQLQSGSLPKAFVGFPFVVLWTTAIVAAFAVPALICCEAAVVLSQLRNSAHIGRLHVVALVVGGIAETIFLLLRAT